MDKLNNLRVETIRAYLNSLIDGENFSEEILAKYVDTYLKYEYVENPRSLYKNLGFTKDEIVEKLGA